MSEASRKLKDALPALERSWTSERVDRVEASMLRRRRNRIATRAAASALLLLIVGVAGLKVWRRPTTLTFADGSTATLLDKTTELRIAASSRERMVVDLVRGGARFEVTHVDGRVFRVEVGQVAVEVVGTRFVVERREDEVRVAVERGRVRVLQGEQATVLGLGEQVVAPATAKPQPLKPATPAQPRPEAPTPVTKQTATSKSVRRASVTAPPVAAAAAPSWKAPAEQGDFDEAYRELSRSGPQSVRDVPNELLLAADVTRLSNHPSEAVPLLERVVRDHSTDPRASLAAFTLGRVLLEELGRPQPAAEAFARARALSPSGPLAADALAREVEAWSRAGDATRARDRAEEYVDRYPHGARVNSVRRFGGIE